MPRFDPVVMADDERQRGDVIQLGWTVDDLALSGLRNDSTQVQFTAPIQPGNSGGPLLDRAGGLAGIVTGKLNDTKTIAGAGFVPQNVNFAIRKEMVVAFLSTQGIELLEMQQSPDVSVADVAEIAKPSVFAVECK